MSATPQDPHSDPSSMQQSGSLDPSWSRALYAVERRLQRRPIRWALAGSQGLKHGWRYGREMLGPAAELLDLPGPVLGPRPRYPHLRLAHLSADPISAGTVPGQRLLPATWRTLLQRDRPDLVLLDDIDGWSPDELDALIDTTGAAIVALPDTAEALPSRRRDPRQVTIVDDDLITTHVDSRRCNPIGLHASPRNGTIITTGPSAVPGAVHLPRNDDEEAALAARTGMCAVEPCQREQDAVAHARRVLHLLAGGTTTVATDTPLLRGLLPNDLADELLMSDSADGMHVRHAARLLASPGFEALGVRARRHVLSNNTSAQAVDLLIGAADLDPAKPPLITVLLCTRRPERIGEAVAAVARQTHPSVELVLVLHGIDRPDDRTMAPRGIPTTVVEVGADRPLGAALDAGLDHARGALIAKMDDDDLYGSDHLADLLVALDYSGADVVGRWSHAVQLVDANITVHAHLDRQECWATHLPGATMLIRGDTLRALRWRHLPNAVDTELVRAVVSRGGGVYSTHRFGFIRRRHGDHTFRRGDRTFRTGADVTEGLDSSTLEA